MKLLVFLLLTLPTYLLAQKINTTSGVGRSNIYNDALSRFVSIVKQQDKNHKEYLDTIFIESNRILHESDIPLFIAGIPTVLVASSTSMYDRGPEQPYILLSISPLAYYQGRFSVFVGITGFERENQDQFNGQHGIIFKYSYKEKEKRFIYQSLEYPRVMTMPAEE